MTNVSTSTKLNVPAATVWNMIGGFNAMAEWHPAFEKSEETTEGGARIRTLTIAGGGGTVVERLERSDDKERSYTYSILSGPAPVANYTSTVKVREDDPGSYTVEWSSTFDPSGAPEDDVQAAVRGIYEAGFENLRKMFGG